MKYLYSTGIFAIASPAFANITSRDNSHLQNFFKFSIGKINITVVSDGSFTMPISSLTINASEEEVKNFLRKYYLPENHLHRETNLAVIDVEDKRLLVDVGSGSRFIGNTGRLFDNLKLAGIEADSITHVFLTHAHPDHILGIRDDFDEAIFPDAEYIMSQNEFNWWTKKDRVNQVDEALTQFVLNAVNSLNALPEITLHEKENEVLPGINILNTAGHTPGHASLLVQSEGSKLLICGDALLDPYASLLFPNWIPENDMEPIKAVESRKKVLSLAANEKMALLGFHFPFPGVGHIIPKGNSYHFLPASIRW
ncbi:MAG: MBL fold metallo-hydrolase [Pseudomonadota bacterium]|nr:MBL fold metallo-hydrolase [Pseudomonadota bacterium]